MLPQLPPIPDDQLTPLLASLLEVIHQQAQLIGQLQDEIARLQARPPRPDLKPSTLTQLGPPAPPGSPPGQRPGSAKRPKTAQLSIHDTQVIPPADLPPGSTFKGYQDFVVQDLVFGAHNTRYRLERWLSPDGLPYVGLLPAAARAGGHFGPTLRAFALDQYYRQRVTQPRLLGQLRSAGIDISSGQLCRLLTEGHDPFHAEKDALLPAGLAASAYVHADDTAARHAGHNGYCTHVGNELFAWFASTGSKSRCNFLGLLRGGHTDYALGPEAFDYLRQQRLPRLPLRLLEGHPGRHFATAADWEAHLDGLGISGEKHRRTATEGALLGSVLAHGVSAELVVVSDDAGQFQILRHGLCWVHAERALDQLLALAPGQQEAVAAVRQEFWGLYWGLRAYQRAPGPQAKAELATQFEALVGRRTGYGRLDRVLRHWRRGRDELLLVLERPEVPLHNNLSERDIREYVIRRKVSGGTRSELGRRCRDTFLSLSKTCGKLGVSFWHYLRDRLSVLGEIAPLPELIRQRALALG